MQVMLASATMVFWVFNQVILVFSISSDWMQSGILLHS